MNMQTSNSRICRFYEANPSIDFETVNLFFVDLFERFSLDTDSSASHIKGFSSTKPLNTSLQMDEIQRSLNNLKTTVSELTNEITNTMIIRFLDIKKEYIDEVKQIVTNNTSDKIYTLLERNNNQLADRTALIVGEIVPKNQEQFFKQVQDTMKHFHKSMREDTQALTKRIDENSIKDFIQNFEVKSTLMLQNLQQPIYAFVASSEERINSNLGALKEISTASHTTQQKLSTDLNDFLNKYRNSSHKGQFGENQLGHVLNKTFETAEIISTGSLRASGDFIMRREGKPIIMFETKDYDRNISPDEIKKFIRDAEEQHCHGIFLSQHTGITSKPNYYIETHNGKLLVYVHNTEYSAEKIQIAVDIIDNLSAKLEVLSVDRKDGSISTEILDEINREYQSFATQKETIINSMKESHKRILHQLDDLKFSCLDKYLSTKYASVQKQGYKCELCKLFTASSLKAMAAHRRGCARKHTSPIPLENNIVVV